MDIYGLKALLALEALWPEGIACSFGSHERLIDEY